MLNADCTSPRSTRRPPRSYALLWFLSGAALIVCLLRLRSMSFRFVYGTDMLQRPIIPLVIILMLAALAYLVALPLAKRSKPSPILVAWILAVGIVLRLLFFGSLPMLEDDYYRYLWDGGVTVSGHNPYKYAPTDIKEGAKAIPPELITLGEDSKQILDRINHGKLRTLYPPVTQATFALAHAIRPWSLPALKAVYLAFDLATLALILLLLRHLKRPILYSALYWWNPLLIKEIYNGAHMDIVVLPFVLAALYAHLKNRHPAAMLTLALAIGAKLWPIILAPLFLWPLRNNPKKLIIALLILTAATTALLLPMLSAAQHQEDSGLVAYSQRWEMNDALYMIFPATAKFILEHFGIEATNTLLQRIGRTTAGLIICLVIGVCTLRRAKSPRHTTSATVAIIATLFLVSPTQFPWYFTWLLPFLALQPRASLLLLTLMLPIYSLKFYYDATNNVDFFHSRIVWLEYTPIWILLLLEQRKSITRPFNKN